MVNKRGRKVASAGVRRVTKNIFSSFTRCSRRSFLCVDGAQATMGTALCFYQCCGAYVPIYLSI